MRIVTVVANSGGRFYCENCSRHGGVAEGLRRRGHEVLTASLYLPPAEGAGDGAASPVFYGAVSLYLGHRLPALRRAPAPVRGILDSMPLLRLAARMSGSTDASGLGGLTLSMLRGEEGEQAGEFDRLVRWIVDLRPDVVHLSNCLLLGCARRLRRELGAPVVCSLQDEHTWIDALGEQERAPAWRILRDRARDASLFLPVSTYYADFMARRLELPADRMRVVPVGIDADAFARAAHELPTRPPVVGYLSRTSDDMGAPVLAEAFIRLAEGGRFPGLRLRFAGGSTAADARCVAAMRRDLGRRGLLRRVDFAPFFGLRDRVDFLSTITVLSVPARIEEAFGTFILESLAAGVPVVEPRRGGFPELVEATGGGVLCEPDDAGALAGALEGLIDDPARARALGRAGRDAVASRYSLQAAAALFEEACRRSARDATVCR